jgi:transcription-repair coupling factor (superfamily II helicase)
VVHVQHGIGRYQGLSGMDMGDGEEEFLTLEFAGGDKLYVPVAHLHLISRYLGGDPDTAPLHRLGSGQWEKAKRRAMEKVRDTAAELLNLYAQRAARKGHARSTSAATTWRRSPKASASRKHPTSMAAIECRGRRHEIRQADGPPGLRRRRLRQDRGRLRAAFVAVADGKQVAVLCPTTLLAEQHFQTFSDRFADWPVKLAELSRFKSRRNVAVGAEGHRGGQDRHPHRHPRLLQKDVSFKSASASSSSTRNTASACARRKR